MRSLLLLVLRCGPRASANLSREDACAAQCAEFNELLANIAFKMYACKRTAGRKTHACVLPDIYTVACLLTHHHSSSIIINCHQSLLSSTPTPTMSSPSQNLNATGAVTKSTRAMPVINVAKPTRTITLLSYFLNRQQLVGALIFRPWVNGACSHHSKGAPMGSGP